MSNGQKLVARLSKKKRFSGKAYGKLTTEGKALLHIIEARTLLTEKKEVDAESVELCFAILAGGGGVTQ